MQTENHFWGTWIQEKLHFSKGMRPSRHHGYVPVSAQLIFKASFTMVLPHCWMGQVILVIQLSGFFVYINKLALIADLIYHYGVAKQHAQEAAGPDDDEKYS